VAKQKQAKSSWWRHLVQLAFQCCTGQLKLKEVTMEEVLLQEQVEAAPNPTVENLGKGKQGWATTIFLPCRQKLGRASRCALRRRIVCGNAISG
jgi:hypothetical protein